MQILTASFLGKRVLKKSGRVKFLWAEETGSRNPNGSWNSASALGMLADPNNPADCFIKLSSSKAHKLCDTTAYN